MSGWRPTTSSSPSATSSGPITKPGTDIQPVLVAQFHPLEDALAAMGMTVSPMVELEADDALASAAHLASGNARVEKVSIWTPDKDLAQCIRGDRVVQVEPSSEDDSRRARACATQFGVGPISIPDFLALVGDAADELPGHPRDWSGHSGKALEPSMARSRISRRASSGKPSTARSCSRHWPP